MKWLSMMLFAVSAGTAAAQPNPPPAAPAPAPPAGPPAPGAAADSPPLSPAAAPNASGPEVLTLERAVEIAMKQQPSLRQTKAQYEAAQGRVDQARVPRNPTLALNASATANSDPACSLRLMTNCGGLFANPSTTVGVTAQANWRIYDFGLTSANIRAAELNAEAAEATIGTTTLDIRNAVEIAYLEAVARRRLVEVAEATVKSEDSHLDQAKRFVAAQAKDPIEVAQAMSRDANAKSALAQAQSNEATALADLRSAIGWVEPLNSPVVSASWPTPPSDVDPPALTALVDTARQHRPEIVQLDKALLAADASVTAALAERRPYLSATASVQASEDLTPSTSSQTDWTAGITLTWLAFDGGKSAADARVARANFASATAQRDALLVSLTSQLDSARAQIVANRANVAASTEAVTAARAQLQLADARYAQGLGSQIELADAQTAVTTAEGNLVQAEFQLATAWAQRHRATAQ